MRQIRCWICFFVETFFIEELCSDACQCLPEGDLCQKPLLLWDVLIAKITQDLPLTPYLKHNDFCLFNRVYIEIPSKLKSSNPFCAITLFLNLIQHYIAFQVVKVLERLKRLKKIINEFRMLRKDYFWRELCGLCARWSSHS